MKHKTTKRTCERDGISIPTAGKKAEISLPFYAPPVVSEHPMISTSRLLSETRVLWWCMARVN